MQPILDFLHIIYDIYVSKLLSMQKLQISIVGATLGKKIESQLTDKN